MTEISGYEWLAGRGHVFARLISEQSLDRFGFALSAGADVLLEH